MFLGSGRGIGGQAGKPEFSVNCCGCATSAAEWVRKNKKPAVAGFSSRDEVLLQRRVDCAISRVPDCPCDSIPVVKKSNWAESMANWFSRRISGRARAAFLADA